LKTFSENLRLFQGFWGFLNTILVEFRLCHSDVRLFSQCLCGLYKSYCPWAFWTIVWYALRSLDWTNIFNLPPHEHRYTLLRLDTLVNRRSITCIMLIFDIQSGRMSSPNFLSAFDLNFPRYRTRDSELLWCSWTDVCHNGRVYRNHWSVTQLFLFLRINCALHPPLCMVPVPGWHIQWTLLSLHQLIVVTVYVLCVCSFKYIT
jgi:hypothetical protein